MYQFINDLLLQSKKLRELIRCTQPDGLSIGSEFKTFTELKQMLNSVQIEIV